MSSISWIRLDGIRSYCHIQMPGDPGAKQRAEVEQTVHFRKPLTLIYGHNGSGKTVIMFIQQTIIEALKAVTCGNQPPNSDKGKNFLTDSQLLRQTQTQGIIELGFKAMNQKDLVVRRHFTVTHSNAQSKFTTGRATIQTKNDQGVLETLNHTCVDVDKQVPLLLGVSVPILSNIIFCHQEEQLWMFGDNSTLKKIFDELFDTTKFSKLQDSIKNQQKKNQSELKKLQETLEFGRKEMEEVARQKEYNYKELILICNEANNLHQLIKQSEQISSKCTISSDNLNQELIDKQKQLSVLQYRQQHNQKEIEELSNQQYQLDLKHKSQIQLQNDSIQLDKTSTELSISKKGIEQNQKDTQLLLDQLELQLQALEDYGSADNIKAELKIIKQQLSNVIQFKGNIADDNLMKVINEQYSQMTIDHKKIQEQYSQQVTDLQVNHDDIEKQQNQMKITEAVKKEQYINAQNSLKSIDQEILQKQYILNQQNQKDDSIIARELNEIQNRLEKNSQQLKKIDEQIIQSYEYESLSQIYSQYIDYQSQSTQTKNSLDETTANIDVLIRELGMIPIYKNCKTRLEKLNKSKEQFKQTEEQIDQLQQKQMKAMAEQTNIDIQVDQLKAKKLTLQQEIEKIKTKVSQSADKPFETLISAVKEQLRAAKEDKIKYVFNTTEFLTQYIEGTKQSNKCILCSQAVNNQILDKLRQRVETNLPKTKIKIEEKDVVIQTLKSEKEKLLKNKESYTALEDLNIKMIEIDDQLIKLKSRVKFENNINEIQELNIQRNKLQDLIVLLSQDQETQVNTLILKVKDIEQNYPKVKTFVNHQQLNLQQLIKQKELINQDTLKQQMQKQELDTQYNQQHAQITKLNNELASLKSKQKEYQSIKPQDDTQEIFQLQEQCMNIKSQIQLLKTSSEQQQSNFDKKAGQIDSQIPQIQKLCTRLTELKKQNKKNNQQQQSITQLQLQISENKILIENMKRTNIEVNTKLEQIQELQNCIKIQQKIVELNSIDFSQIQVFQRDIQMGNITLEQIKQAESELIKINSSVSVTKANIIDREQRYEQSKQDLEKRSKNAEQRYQQQLYQMQVLKAIISDLNIFSKAQEEGLLTFHRNKMREINRYLRDTWSKIYHGNDIRYIEIKSDEDPNAKKSYNYRLVMRSSNNVEIDMRGRCSMGQKMLASIVFRMALAENFGSNCGVLTLDEPTANLDKTHIQSLTESLATLIDIMSTNKQSFQLIIITHDLDLVKLLSKHSHTYYKIQKNENGFSSATERQIEELY